MLLSPSREFLTPYKFQEKLLLILSLCWNYFNKMTKDSFLQKHQHLNVTNNNRENYFAQFALGITCAQPMRIKQTKDKTAQVILNINFIVAY